MKLRLALLVLVIISAPLAALAGEAKPPLSDEKLSKMQQKLSLTDAQLTEMRKIRDDGGTSKDMRAVLTDEQTAQAKQLKKKHQKQKKHQKEENKSAKEQKPKGKGKTGDVA